LCCQTSCYYTLNRASTAWSTGPSLPAGLDQPGVVFINSVLLVFGSTASAVYSNKVYQLTAYNAAFTTISTTFPAKNGFASAVFGNTIYVLLGVNGTAAQSSVYTSVDYGVTWQGVSTPATNNMLAPFNQGAGIIITKNTTNQVNPIM
jgi:hypothetical protein